MNKKGKRNKGNAARPSKRPTPLPPTSSAVSQAPSSVSAPTPSSSARTPNTEARQDVAVAAAVEAEPAMPDPDLAARDDDQEESGPRIVAHVAVPTPPPQAGPAAPKSQDFKHEEKVIVREPPAPAPKAREEIRPAPAKEAESIPPVSSHGAEAHELDHDFFADGERADKEHREAARRPAAQFSEPPEEDPKASQKMTPAVRARRARFTKYVKWAVGASAIVCLAALVRVAVARSQHEPEPRPVAAAAANVQAVPVAPQPPPQAPQPPPQAAPPVQQAVDTPAPAPAPTAPAAAPAADTAQAAAAAPADVPTDPAAAKEEKKAAQKALNRGDLKGAIEAGERAVAYDPTDGDSWLILGAAYQEKGKGADARKAFTSCIKEGKRGAIGECRAMLR